MTVPANAPDQGAAAESGTTGALSKLIQEAKDSGLSYQDMADRAVDPDSGARYYKQSLQKLVKNPPTNPPTPAQMKALSAGTGRSLRAIKEAAAEQWLEYEATELAGYGNEVRIIVGHLAGMPESELRRWRAMIEADERARREER